MGYVICDVIKQDSQCNIWLVAVAEIYVVVVTTASTQFSMGTIFFLSPFPSHLTRKPKLHILSITFVTFIYGNIFFYQIFFK